VGLERGPLSHVMINEELLELRSRKLRLTTVGVRSADHATPSTRKSRYQLRGRRWSSVGIIHLMTNSNRICLCLSEPNLTFAITTDSAENSRLSLRNNETECMEPSLHFHSIVSVVTGNVNFIVTCHWLALGYHEPIISTPPPPVLLQSPSRCSRGVVEGGSASKEIPYFTRWLLLTSTEDGY
jgi:hypothetical protein